MLLLDVPEAVKALRQEMFKYKKKKSTLKGSSREQEVWGGDGVVVLIVCREVGCGWLFGVWGFREC